MAEITREKIEQLYADGYRMRSSMAIALDVTNQAMQAAVIANDVGFLFDPKAVDIHVIRRYAENQQRPITTYSQITNGIKTSSTSISSATVRDCMEANGETFKTLGQCRKKRLKTVRAHYPRETIPKSNERIRCEMIRAAA